MAKFNVDDWIYDISTSTISIGQIIGIKNDGLTYVVDIMIRIPIDPSQYAGKDIRATIFDSSIIEKNFKLVDEISKSRKQYILYQILRMK